MNQKIFYTTLSSLSCFFVLTLPAIACGIGMIKDHLFAFELVILPSSVVFFPYGLPILTIMGIEAFVLHQRENLSYPKSFGLAFLANAVYFFATIAYLLSPYLPGNYWLGGFLSAMMVLYFCWQTSSLNFLKQNRSKILFFLFFLVLTAVHIGLIELFSASVSPIFLYPMTAGLLAIGFILLLVVKGFAIAVFLREKRPTLAATVFSMVVASFPVIPITLLLNGSQVF